MQKQHQIIRSRQSNNRISQLNNLYSFIFGYKCTNNFGNNNNIRNHSNNNNHHHHGHNDDFEEQDFNNDDDEPKIKKITYMVDGKKITRTEEPYYEDDGSVKIHVKEENEDGDVVEYFE